MLKVTVLFNHPTDAEAFERHYTQTHLPLAGKMQGVSRLELTRFDTSPNGSKPDYYRMAELYFPSQAQLEATLGSPEGKATVEDIANFATGGVKMLIGEVEN